MTSPPTNLAAPHSCGDICSRKRHTCAHSCPLPCHPGPCPPCQVARIVPCPSHNRSLTVKCHMSSNQSTSMTPVCGTDCGRALACGNKDHECDSPCHYGPCQPCEVIETVRCYCGQHRKEVPCGWHKDKELLSASSSLDGVPEEWKGRYNCGEQCNRFYDCGIHPCKDVSTQTIFDSCLEPLRLESKLTFRHVTLIRSSHSSVPILQTRSLTVRVESLRSRTSLITPDQTVSPQSRRAVPDVRNCDLVGILVHLHAMKDHAHLVMKRW